MGNQPVSLDQLRANFQPPQQDATQVVQPTSVENPTPINVPSSTSQPVAKPGFFSQLGDALSKTGMAPGVGNFGSIIPGFFKNAGEAALKALNAPKTQPTIQDKLIEHITGKKTDLNAPPSFVQRAVTDVASLGPGLAIGLSDPVAMAKATFIGGKAGDPLLERLGKGALVSSVTSLVDPKFAWEHPGMYAINAGTAIASVASFGLASIAKSTIAAGVETGITEAALAGVESATVKTALESSALKLATKEAIKTGDTAIVGEVAKQALIKQGLTEEIATQISSKVAGGMTEHLATNATKLKAFQATSHPLDTTMGGISQAIDPIKKVVFGEPANTAVGRIFGTDAVAKDPQNFLDMETMASQQAVEQGLPDTIDSRETIMMGWGKTDPAYSVLTPEEKIAHMQNDIRANVYARQMSQMTGDPIVPGRSLAPESVSAITKTIEASPASMSPVGILDELQKLYGSELKLHRPTLEYLLSKDPTREALAAGIEALGNPDIMSMSNPEAIKAAQKMIDETGYHPVMAPTGKNISYATPEELAAARARSGANGGDVIPADVSGLSKGRTNLGQQMVDLGLSPAGGNEANIEYLYQNNFNQSALKDLAPKYGETFTVEHQTVPFSKLYEFLNNMKDEVSKNRGLTGSLSEFLKPIGLGVNNIIDFSVGDLTHFGFEPKLANDIVGNIKSSLTDIPYEQTGLADGISNMMKAKVPGYNKFMKYSMVGRFNMNPFYGAQAWVELEFNKAVSLITGGGNVGDVLRGIDVGARLAPIKTSIAEVLSKIPYLKDAINPEITFQENYLVNNELLSGLEKNTLTPTSNPEMALLEKAAVDGVSAEEKAAFIKSTQSKNIIFRMMGYTTQRAATSFAKVLANKFGFSVEEALGSTMVNGNKVYNNPELFNLLRESTADLVGYKPGFLTSPLAKTMNVIWFPFRFEAKTVMGVSEAIGKLPPITRLGFTSDVTHFAAWSQTPEGVKWRASNDHKMYNMLNYVFTWESSGAALKDAFNGNLFGGNVGQLGGLPFNFFVKIAQDLGTRQIPEREGFKPKSTQIPKNLISAASAQIIAEDLIMHVTPKMPLYQLFNTQTTPDTYLKNTLIPSVFSSIWEHGVKRSQKKFNREQFKTLPPGKNRFQ